MAKRSAVERFWSRIRFHPHPDGCWEWTHTLWDQGYGRLKHNGYDDRAHRFSYALLVGPIPDGLVIDHLCRNRACVRPDHLEPVTDRVNLLRGNTVNAVNARKTHCLRSHPLSGDNLYVTPTGKRNCRICLRMHQRKRRQKDSRAITPLHS